MVLFTVYGYGLLLRCDVMKRAERNTHSKATEEAGMHKICSLISKELAVQILSSGPLDPSMGKLFHFTEKSFTPHKTMPTKEKWKKRYIYLYFFSILSSEMKRWMKDFPIT